MQLKTPLHTGPLFSKTAFAMNCYVFSSSFQVCILHYSICSLHILQPKYLSDSCMFRKIIWEDINCMKEYERGKYWLRIFWSSFVLFSFHPSNVKINYFCHRKKKTSKKALGTGGGIQAKKKTKQNNQLKTKQTSKKPKPKQNNKKQQSWKLQSENKNIERTPKIYHKRAVHIN